MTKLEEKLNQIIDEQKLEIAAKWWWNVIQKPKHDNGDNSFTGFLTMKMADSLVEEITLTYEEFKDCLKRKCLGFIEKFSYIRDIDFHCDYGPCGILSEVAEELNIPEFNFPFKTSMWVKENSVVVSYGYRAKHQILYATKEYWEEKINSTKESIKNYENNYFEWLTEEENAERIKELENDLIKYNEELKNYD